MRGASTAAQRSTSPPSASKRARRSWIDLAQRLAALAGDLGARKLDREQRIAAAFLAEPRGVGLRRARADDLAHGVLAERLEVELLEQPRHGAARAARACTGVLSRSSSRRAASKTSTVELALVRTT